MKVIICVILQLPYQRNSSKPYAPLSRSRPLDFYPYPSPHHVLEILPVYVTYPSFDFKFFPSPSPYPHPYFKICPYPISTLYALWVRNRYGVGIPSTHIGVWVRHSCSYIYLNAVSKLKFLQKLLFIYIKQSN